MSRPDLRLDWCSHAAAKYAVEKWHYSRTMPVGKMAKIGVWEGGEFIGVVLFAQGNNQHQGKAHGLTMHHVCELVRVALRTHVWPVSRIVSIALGLLRKACPGLRLVLSYADPEQGHAGGIYQAGGWVYVGVGGAGEAYYNRAGQRVHSRLVSKTGVKEHFGRYTASLRSDDLTRVPLLKKHKYLMPLDDAMRAQIAPLARPYPKRAKHPSDAPAVQAGEGGAAPTRTLHEAAV